jgi:hypothetical protein
MARKITKTTGGDVALTTAVRNTAIPKTQTTQPRREVTHEMIARRAYEIARSGASGSQLDHWLRAERELLGR